MRYILIIFTALALVGCRNEYFTIEGRIDDGGTQNLRIVYATDYETLQTDWVTMTDGRFQYQGVNYDWTVAYVIDSRKQVIARAAVRNGDDIAISGLLRDAPWGMTVEGNEPNEQWSNFAVQNAQLYSLPDRQPLAQAIEEYVQANPDKISSTLLLLNDYAGASVDTLYQSISIDARPSGLVNNYLALQQQLDDERSRDNVSAITLYSSEDTITTVATSRYRATLIYFWDRRDPGRAGTVKQLRQLYEQHEAEGRVQVVDVMLSADTAGWHRMLHRDSTQWRHYWSPGGPLHRNIVNLNITTTPYFIVASSSGRQLYRGGSLQEAAKHVR